MSADFQNAALLSWKLCGLPGQRGRIPDPRLRLLAVVVPGRDKECHVALGPRAGARDRLDARRPKSSSRRVRGGRLHQRRVGMKPGWRDVSQRASPRTSSRPPFAPPE